MKTKLTSILISLLFISVLIAGCNKQDSSNQTQKTDTTKTVTKTNSNSGMDMMTSMDKMMKNMNGMKMTGDNDLDFATMMIEHHKGAIEMSEIELKNGTDDKIKSIAKNIITAQKDEIARMQEFVTSHKPVSWGKMGMMNSMKDMGDMMNNMKMYNNTDKDFVSMMIIHHQGAVTMAENEVATGKNAGMKKMAAQMIIDQKKEIADFQAWMNSSK